MRIKNIPFNISLLSNEQKVVAGLLPVTDLAIYGDDGGFAKTGLYSEVIFGRPGSELRNKRHGYINLRTQVLHPKIFDELKRLGKLYIGIMNGTMYAKWDPKEKDFIKSDLMEGETGYSFFMKHLDELKIKKNNSKSRNLRIQVFEKYRHLAKIHFLLVMPAGLRDVRMSESGRPIEDEINKLYRKVMILARGIPDAMAFKDDPVMDRARMSMQYAVQAVYDNIMAMLSGKRGFLQEKWATRKVAHGTRNVISSMDPGTDVLGGDRSFDSATAMFGLYQVLRGVEPVTVNWAMPRSMAKDVIANADSEVLLIDPKTLKPVQVRLSEKARTRWATKQGRSDLIGVYEELSYRHQPIKIDGYYLKLIYQDDTSFKVFDSIEELPENLDPNKVHPVTWAEYFYLTIEPEMHRFRGHITRYPITGIESVHPVVPYLRTTVKSYVLYERDSQWQITKDSKKWLEFPDTLNKGSFMDSLSIPPATLALLGADFDGDVISATLVYSDEAVQEVDRRLNSVEQHLDASGKPFLDMSFQGAMDLIYLNFTGDYS